MPMTDAGAGLVAKLLIGDTAQVLNNAAAHIGVGDSSAVFAAGQTDLQAAVNKLRVAMSATYPLRAGSVLEFRSLFGTTDANFDWNEWGLFNANAGGEMLLREVAALGTKNSSQSWQLSVSVTVVPA